MNNGYQELTLETVGKGVLPALFEREKKKVMANIADENTRATTARKITIEITLTPKEDRDMAECTVAISSKLATPKTVSSPVYIANNGKELIAYENHQESPLMFDENVSPISKASK